MIVSYRWSDEGDLLEGSRNETLSKVHPPLHGVADILACVSWD
jgi:hypothetical protein